MFAAIILCLFYFQFLPTTTGQQVLVIGGNDIEIADAPYMLSLRRLGHHVCGATVISNFWTVTAAHCVMKAFPSQITFRGGNKNRLLGSLFEAERIVLHPGFNIEYEFDIAVVRTVQEMIQNGNSITALGIGIQGTISPGGSFGNVTGWGMIESTNAALPEYLKVTRVTFIDNQQCNETLWKFGGTTINNLCTIATTSTGYEDFCLGDEGGPLVQDNRIVGVASWSPECGSSAWPSVYTRITIISIRSFIHEITGI